MLSSAKYHMTKFDDYIGYAF